jgi:hypothetical protein
MSSLSSNLKQQIKDAIHAIYYNQGTQAALAFEGPDQVAKALLDILFPEEVEHNTEVTGVAVIPTLPEAAPASDSESTDSKKERKKRAPMSDEAKAAMAAKRAATLAAKAAAPPAKPEPEPGTTNAAAGAGGGGGGGPPAAAPAKERKPRGPMSDEAKAQMKAKRDATIAAKKAAV